MNTEIIDLKVPYNDGGLPLKERNCRLYSYILKKPVYKSEKGRMAVLICPGGGYTRVSPREGEPVALRINAMGYHAFVLEYSTQQDRFPTQLMEAGSAMAYIREHSADWDIDPDRILIMGFSAGGHLACSLGCFWNQGFLQEFLSKSAEEIRPNGLILCYPVITSGEFAHRGSFQALLGGERMELMDKVSLEKQVGPQVPKTFLWHTYTDTSVPVENSFLFASALKQEGINLEMHIYPVGEHGLSLATEVTQNERGEGIEVQCQSWISLLETWLSNF